MTYNVKSCCFNCEIIIYMPLGEKNVGLKTDESK